MVVHKHADVSHGHRVAEYRAIGTPGKFSINVVCHSVGINLRINLKVYIMDNTEENGYVPGKFSKKGTRTPGRLKYQRHCQENYMMTNHRPRRNEVSNK